MKNILAFVVLALAVPGIRSAGAVQAVPSVPVAAGEALGGFGGSLELPAPGLLFQPCLKPNGWTTRFALEDNFTKPAQGAHAYFFVPDADKDGGAPGRHGDVYADAGRRRGPLCRTFNGLLSALVVATPGTTGKISVTFMAEGLAPVTAQLDAAASADLTGFGEM